MRKLIFKFLICQEDRLSKYWIECILETPMQLWLYMMWLIKRVLGQVRLPKSRESEGLGLLDVACHDFGTPLVFCTQRPLLFSRFCRVVCDLLNPVAPHSVVSFLVSAVILHLSCYLKNSIWKFLCFCWRLVFAVSLEMIEWLFRGRRLYMDHLWLH